MIVVFLLGNQTTQEVYEAEIVRRNEFHYLRDTVLAHSDLVCAIMCTYKDQNQCSLFRFDGKRCYFYPHWQSADLIKCTDCNETSETFKIYFRTKTCEAGWFRSTDGLSCYKIGPTKMKRGLAQQYCRSLSNRTDLATIRTAEDNKKLVAEAKRRFAHDGRIAFLIKLNDLSKEGDFVWDDEFRGGLRLWASNAPDNLHGSQHCAVVIAFEPKLNEWDDVSCQDPKYFACEAF